MSVQKPSNPPSGGSARAMRRLMPSTAQPAPPARHSAAVTKYWKAVCDTNVFDAPFGHPCGDVEAGTVVEEGMRYVDLFDDMWIAVQADDGSAVWARRYATGSLTEPREAEWEPVAESTSTAVSAVEIAMEPLRVADNVMAHALELVTPDAVLMEYFWDHVYRADGTSSDRDWNHELQSGIEEVLYKCSGGKGSSSNPRAVLAKVISDFADEVETSASKIVQEMFIPSAQRTIKRHPTALDIFYHCGVMYRLCVDTSGGLYGGDHNALKVASQCHRAVHQLLQIAPMYFLHVPLVTIMTINGFRILASTICPVKTSRQLMGPKVSSPLAQKPTRASGASQLPGKLLARLGSRLSLKLHSYNDDGQGYFPCDAQVFAGVDHRLYMLNTARLFPPTAPSQYSQSYHPRTTPLFQRMRPEILEKCGRELNPDAFFPLCSDEASNRDTVTISQWLRDEGIPTVAALIGMHEAVDQPELPTVVCRGCEREVSNELRFVVCRHETECCCVCSQCYIDTLKLHHFEENAPAVAEKLHAFVRCSTAPRSIRGLLLKPDVTSIFHANCVNMRYLPMVYHQLPKSAAMCTVQYLEIEMIARAAKHMLWQKLRVTHDAEQARTVCVNFYLALLQPEGELAEQFWANDLGPAIQSQFDIFAPFNTAELDNELVYRRVSELTGVELTAESVASFSSETPFVQLKAIHPVMKMQQIPHYVEHVGQHEVALKGILEELLLFWIGVGGDQADWEHKYPLYLKEKF